MNRLKKSAFRGLGYLVLAFAILFCTNAVAFADLQDIIKRGELRVAMYSQGPPFSFYNKNNEFVGSSVDLAKLMAKEMGVELKIINYDWDGLIPSLLSKKTDIIAADMTPKLKRALRVNFSTPFLYTHDSLWKKKGNNRVNSMEDANKPGVKIAVLLGSASEANAKKRFPNAELKSFKGGGGMLINAVLQGKADFGFNDLIACVAQRAQFPPGSIEFVEGDYDKSPLSFAVRPEDSHLLHWVDLFFDWIDLDGRMKDNLNYWVESEQWQIDNL